MLLVFHNLFIQLLNNIFTGLRFLSVFGFFVWLFLFAMITKSLVWADVETLGDRDLGRDVVV